MLYPKFPQRYLAAIVVCLILTLGLLGALFLIYLFNEGRSPLIPHNGSAGAGTNAGVVSLKLALSAQPLLQQQQLQEQQLHETRHPLKKRIYLQQPVAMLNANEDDDDDDEVTGGGDGGGGILGDSEGDASARFQSTHGGESDYVENEDMLNIDADISERRQQHLSTQQHFVDDNYQLQDMLGAVVDDNAEQPPTQPKREQLLLPKQRPSMLHDALVAGVGSAELSIDDNEDEDDDLGDDYDISISAELWHQRKPPRRKQAQRLDALELDVQRHDNNYDTIYIDDLERPPATPSGGGGLQRPRDALVNMEIADINYFDTIIDGGERDDKGATVGGVVAAAAPATAATTRGSQPLQQQKLQKQQRRKNRQQSKNRQQQHQQKQQQKLLRGRYSELTVARHVLPLYYLNMLYNKHRQHKNNNKERRPVSVDDEGGDDEDIDADGEIEEAYLVGSGSGTGALAADGYSFRDVDAAEEIEDDIDAAETAEFIKRINSKMRQAAKKGGSYGNSNNNNNNIDLGRNCDNSYSNDANKNNAAGNNNRNSNNNHSNYKERNHMQQMLAKHVGCNINKSTTTAAAAETSGGSVKHYAYDLRNGSSNNNSSDSSRSSAVIEAIDFYNFSSELVGNLSAPLLYQDEKFVSNVRTAAAAAAAAATGDTTMATPSTAATAAANSGTATKKSIAAVTAPLTLRAAATTGIANSNNNKVWPPGTAAAPTVAFATKTTATASRRLTAPKIAEPQQPFAINVAAAELPEVTSTGGDNMRSGGGGTLFNSAAWLETRTRRIIGNVKKSEERSRQLLLCEEAGGGELCRMLFKGHLNE